MRNKNLCSFIVFILLFSNSFAQEYTFKENSGKDGLYLISSKNNIIECQFTIEKFKLIDSKAENIPMKSIVWGSSFLPGKEGEPQLPSITKSFIIPHDSEIEVIIKNSNEQIIEDLIIIPAAKTPINSKDEFFLAKRGPVYSKNSFYPSEPLSYHLTEIRGMQMLVLSIIPFQYNPVTKELIVNTNLEIEINSTSSSEELVEDRFRSPFWDQILADIVFNINDIPDVDYSKREPKKDIDGCDLLILTPPKPEFLQWADTIRRFRNEQGIYTKVLTTEDIGGNIQDSINSFFEEMYNTWNPVPSAVLFLGDSKWENNGIGPKLFEDHPENVPYVSDSYYTDITNNELPDFVLGRISANDSIELEAIISKYIKHERNPSLKESYYNPLSIGAFQFDLWFQICLESINGYMKNSLGKNPVRINELLWSNNIHSLWSEAPNSSLPINYFGVDGLNYIPEDPKDVGHWGGGTTQEIAEALNKGASLTIYRDHGGVKRFDIPEFSIDDIDLLTNKEFPTFLFSFACYNGAFNYPYNCIMEELHRKNHAGVLGGIAATTWTFSFYNDALLWGTIDNLWPGFLPDYGSPVIPHRDFRPAFGLAAGKYYMLNSNWIPTDSIRILTSRVWTHFGDPFLSVFTSLPSKNPVQHPFSISTITESIDIQAEPLSLVGLSINGELLISSITDDVGKATLNFPAQTALTKIKLVTTKQNYLRYEEDIWIVPDDGSYTKCMKTKLYDDNDDRELEYGEKAYYDVFIRNYGMEAAQNIKLKLISDDEYIKIISDTVFIIDSIAAQSDYRLSNKFQILSRIKTPDQHKVHFKLETTNIDSSNMYYFSEKSNAPLLNYTLPVYEEIEGNNNHLPEPGEKLNASFFIINNGHRSIFNNELKIENNSEQIIITNAIAQFDELAPNDSIQINFQIEISANAMMDATYANIYRITSNKKNFTYYYYFTMTSIMEDFETHDFTKYDWHFEGDKEWEITNAQVNNGEFSATIQDLGNNEEAALCLDYHVWSENFLDFYILVSTEHNKDFLSFYIDSVLMDSWSHLHLWENNKFMVPKGDHTFKWVYKKDSTNSGGLDAIWLDDISLPPGQKITNTLEVDQPQINDISIHPNPAENYISIRNNTDDILEELIITDLLGKQLLSKPLSFHHKKIITINIENLKSGIYILSVNLESGKSHSFKLIVQ